LFAKKVTDHYCEAAAKHQNLWIQIGADHGEQVECLLKTYLPEGAEIEVIPAATLKDVYATWKTDARPMLDELKKFVSEKSPTAELSIKTEPDMNGESFALVSPHEISVSILKRRGIALEDLKQMIEGRGYKVIRHLDIPDEILTFTITFDITAMK
jgi:hypothetical protein